MLGRYRQRYPELNNRTLDADQAGVVDGNCDIQDLAKAPFGKANVSCWTEPQDRKWGIHNDRDAAILRLRMHASGPEDCKMCHFEIDMTFSAMNDGDATDELSTNGMRPSCPNEADVRLIKLPAPLFVKGPFENDASLDHGQLGGCQKLSRKACYCCKGQSTPLLVRYWKFRSESVNSDGNGQALSARWVWEADGGHRQIQGRLLHGGVALRHSGTSFLIRCHVRGKVSKPGGLRLKFSNEHHKPRVWRVMPESSQEDIRQLIDRLEAEMIEMNSPPVCGKQALPR